MTEARLRAAVATTAGLLALGALWWLPQRPAPRQRLPVDRGVPAPPVARGDTIRRGEGTRAALRRLGLPDDAARRVADAAGLPGTARRALAITLRADSAGAPVSDLELHVADDRVVRVRRAPDGGWEATQRRVAWTVDTLVVRAPFRGTLVGTFREAASALPVHLRSEIAYRIADAYQYRLDVSRDLGPTDSVVAVVERRRTPLGTVRLGALLAAAIRDDGTWLDATRHVDARGREDWYDRDGRPLRTAYLQAPLDVVRISSRFGRRLHPVLGIWHDHAGTDYAAPHGTPVRAVGDGVVTAAGPSGAYGNLVELRHLDGVVTRYGHLSRYARGLRVGQVIQRGDVIAYVGSTGRSTAPHLHFEVKVRGVVREPARALRAAAGTTLAGGELSIFRAARARLQARIGVAALLSDAELASRAETPATAVLAADSAAARSVALPTAPAPLPTPARTRRGR